MVTHVYLLRHGQTEWSLSGRHTGLTDIPLTPQGENEARASGELLRGIQFDRVLTSPRIRARKTCELAGLSASPEVNQDLREWEYGEYEGLLTHEIVKRHPGWMVFEHGCPGGESPQQVSDRADRLLAAVRKMDGKVVLVSHGHYTRVLAARWVGLSIAQAKIFGSSTAAVSILGFSENNGRPVLSLWNRAPSIQSV